MDGQDLLFILHLANPSRDNSGLGRDNGRRIKYKPELRVSQDNTSGLAFCPAGNVRFCS